jgi:hypothetical protein
MHYIYLSISLLHTVIDLIEQEREKLTEPAPVEDTNLKQDQGKPPVAEMPKYCECYGKFVWPSADPPEGWEVSWEPKL